MRRFTSSDILDMKWVSDPQISPDGSQALFTIKKVIEQEKKHKYQTNIFLARDGHVTQFTFGPASDSSPRWSPDGSSVAFLSDRDKEKTQLYVIPSTGGEAVRVTARKDGVGEPVWSPDGKKIAFSALCDEEGETQGNAAAASARESDGGEGPARDGGQKSDVRVITRIRYKLNGKGFLPDKAAQVLVLDVESGKIEQLTRGEYDCREPRWSPDGQQIAFVSARFEGCDLTSVRDIYVVPAKGGEIRKITSSDLSLASPSWSPDGKSIAFYGHDNRNKGATTAGLCVVPAAGGVVRFLTREAELDVAQTAGGDMGGSPIVPPAWSPDAKDVFFTALSRGRAHLYSVSVESGTIKKLTWGDSTVSGWSFSPETGDFVVHIQTPTLIGDMFALTRPSLACSGPTGWDAFPLETSPAPFELQGSVPLNVRRVTCVNAGVLSSRSLSVPEEFSVPSRDGTMVHGWIMRPPGLKEGEKCPAALEIHGGPTFRTGTSSVTSFNFLPRAGTPWFTATPEEAQDTVRITQPPSATIGEAWTTRMSWRQRATRPHCLGSIPGEWGFSAAATGVT